MGFAFHAAKVLSMLHGRDGLKHLTRLGVNSTSANALDAQKVFGERGAIRTSDRVSRDFNEIRRHFGPTATPKSGIEWVGFTPPMLLRRRKPAAASSAPQATGSRFDRPRRGAHEGDCVRPGQRLLGPVFDQGELSPKFLMRRDRPRHDLWLRRGRLWNIGHRALPKKTGCTRISRLIISCQGNKCLISDLHCNKWAGWRGGENTDMSPLDRVLAIAPVEPEEPYRDVATTAPT